LGVGQELVAPHRWKKQQVTKWYTRAQWLQFSEFSKTMQSIRKILIGQQV
jgi:hypothetical protein